MKSETTTSPQGSKEKKRTFYDKRLIKKIVKEIEGDMPRSEAVAIYGMSPSTLKNWIETYALAFKDSEKRTVVRAVESQRLSPKSHLSFSCFLKLSLHNKRGCYCI